MAQQSGQQGMSDAVTNNWNLSMAGISLHSTQHSTPAQHMQVVSRTGGGGGCIVPLKYTATACHSPICRYSKMYCTSHGESTKAYCAEVVGMLLSPWGLWTSPLSCVGASPATISALRWPNGSTLHSHQHAQQHLCSPFSCYPFGLSSALQQIITHWAMCIHYSQMAMHCAWSLSPVD